MCRSFCGHMSSFLLRREPKGEIAGLYVNSMFNIIKNIFLVYFIKYKYISHIISMYLYIYHIRIVSLDRICSLAGMQKPS